MRPEFSNFEELAAHANHGAVSALRDRSTGGFARVVDGGDGPEQARGERTRRSGWDDPSLYLLALTIGLIPIVAVVLRGGPWGAEPTLGIVLSVLAVGGLSKHAVEWSSRRG